MSADGGFCNIVTDGTYLYSSNTLERAICSINSAGFIDNSFIVVEPTDSPLTLAIGGRYLFVYALRTTDNTFGVVLMYSLDTKSIVETYIVPSSSSVYPTLRFYESKLYLSNYEKGSIIEIDLISSMINTYETGIIGISGMCFGYGVLYFSCEPKNAIFTTVLKPGPLQVDIKYEVDTPKGMDSYEDNIYVCYGKDKTNCGIATYSIIESKKIAVMNFYLLLQIPINVLYSTNFFCTALSSDVIYRDTSIFAIASFAPPVEYNPNRITQSVVATNQACLKNPAFRGLINLRTVGSNPNNPITPITSLTGRTTGNNIQFNMGIGTSYESLKMRRKAETLKYRNSVNSPGITLTDKELYTMVINKGGAFRYSRLRIKQLLEANDGKLPCDVGVNNGKPVEITAPTNSGVIDPNFEGYFLNPYLTYYPSL